MRWTFAVFASVALAAAIIGCSSSPAASPTPGATLAPGATATPAGATPGATPGATATPAGPTNPPVSGTGHECDPFPTIDPSHPSLPSFAPDTTLVAKYPTQIDGQAATGLTTGSWAQFLCIGGQAGYNQAVQGLPAGFNWAALTYGVAKYTVDGDEVTLFAFRSPGQDATALVQAMAQLAAASGQEQQGTLSSGSLGGKSVLILTDASGEKSYGYLSGDTLFFTGTVTDSQAAKIVAALP